MNRVYCCYPGGKHKALTFSYDDGRAADRKLVRLFNQYGLRATFNLNSGTLGRSEPEYVKPEEVAELYAGHEIAVHTVSHPTLERCPLPAVAQEILEDRKALEKLTGYPVRGMAYPNGSVSPEIEKLLPLCGIRYARAVGSTAGFGLPENTGRWMPTCHHDDPGLTDLGEQLINFHKTQYLRLMYVWGHSYEFDANNSWGKMEQFCRMMSGKDDIWYCTNIELTDCLDDFRRLCFAADNSFVLNPNARDCWIEAEGKTVCIPAGATVHLQ